MDTPPVAEILTGHAEWDRQHHLLHELLKRLDTVVAAHSQASPEAAPALQSEFLDILSETLTVMIKHFHWEETLMKTLPSNPLSDAHCAFHREEHIGISEKLANLAKELDQQALPESVQSLAQILVDWLSAHIRGYDQPFVRLLTANGWKLQDEGIQPL